MVVNALYHNAMLFNVTFESVILVEKNSITPTSLTVDTTVSIHTAASVLIHQIATGRPILTWIRDTLFDVCNHK